MHERKVPGTQGGNDQGTSLAKLEAMLEEQEQGRMYHVTFDLRELTREERDQLEAIYNALEARRGECHA